MSLAKEQNAPPKIRNCWTRLVGPYLKALNSKLSKGSKTLRRMDVTRANFGDLLRERYGSGANLAHLNATLTHTNIGPRFSERVFKYHLGQKVCDRLVYY